MRWSYLLLMIMRSCGRAAEDKDTGIVTAHKPSDLEQALIAAGHDGLFLSGPAVMASSSR
jgi:hypothetical protein